MNQRGVLDARSTLNIHSLEFQLESRRGPVSCFLEACKTLYTKPPVFLINYPTVLERGAF
jgi:hypothetical protein